MLWNGSPDTASSLLTHVLSTITSPVFSEVTACYRDYNFCGVQGCVQASWLQPQSRPPFRVMSQAERAKEASHHRKRFEVFHKMHKVRDFQLVLCADVWDRVGEYSVRMLRRVVADEKARGGFGQPLSEPLVTYRPRGSCPHWLEIQFAAGISCYPTAWTPL